jgi:AcrR family transcriptional regulator
MAPPTASTTPTGSPVDRVRRRLPAARRRTQLLDAAAELLARDGVAAEAVTMEAVAADAGVSKSLVYRHFDNAEALLAAVAGREMDAVAERVRVAVNRAPTFEDAVHASIAAWFDELSARGGLMVALLEAPALAGSLDEHRRQLRARIGELYSTRARSTFGLSRRSAEVATVILLAGLEGVIECWVDRQVTRRELVDTYTTMVLASFEALAERPPLIGE